MEWRGAAAGVLWAGAGAGGTPQRSPAVVDELCAAGSSYSGSVVVLTAPCEVRDVVDLWGPVPGLDLMRRLKLKTVCEEAACPNIGECWTKKHATVMILGDTCTRACAFCNEKTGMPRDVDALEPQHNSEAAAELGTSTNSI